MHDGRVLDPTPIAHQHLDSHIVPLFVVGGAAVAVRVLAVAVDEVAVGAVEIVHGKVAVLVAEGVSFGLDLGGIMVFARGGGGAADGAGGAVGGC